MLRTLFALALVVTIQARSAVFEPAYSALGVGNTTSGFTIPIKINNGNVASMTDLHAQVSYAPLYASTDLKTGPLTKVTVGEIPGTASFFAINVTGLRKTTVYRAFVNVYRGNGTHVGQSSVYYTSTTGPDPKSLIRTRMVLKGLKEFYDSERGLVGKNGTVDVDGTRYGADVGEAWCSEFYSWVAQGHLKNFGGIGHYAVMIERFTQAGGYFKRSAIPTKARRGDYLAMDTDDVKGTNHSGMFLAFEKQSDGQEFVWTLEGNSGKKVRVNRRPFNKLFMGLGHIMASQF